MNDAFKKFVRDLLPIAERLSGNRLRIIPAAEIYSIHEQEHLKKFISHFGVDCIFNVGANKGQYATMIRNNVGFRGQIISFEPDPECVATLKDLSRSDPLWRVEDCVLSDKSGEELEFNIMTTNQYNSIARPSVEERSDLGISIQVAKTIKMRAKTIAELFDGYRAEFKFERPFLKMDTQGNDLNVARGAGDTLERFVGLQSELAVVKLYEGAPGYAEAIDFYQARGFSLSAFVPNNQGHFPRLVETDCIMFNNRFI